MNAYSFYGGRTGAPFEIVKVYPNLTELLNSLNTDPNVQYNEYVRVDYTTSNTTSEKFSEMNNKDKAVFPDRYYTTNANDQRVLINEIANQTNWNNSVWQKTVDGILFVVNLSSNTPNFDVDINPLNPSDEPDVELTGGNTDNPHLIFGIPRAAKIFTGKKTPESEGMLDGDYYITTNGVMYQFNGTDFDEQGVIKNAPIPTVLTGSAPAATVLDDGSGWQLTVPNATQWYVGEGAPDDNDGADNDFYINQLNSNTYKKKKGKWEYQADLIGSDSQLQIIDSITSVWIDEVDDKNDRLTASSALDKSLPTNSSFKLSVQNSFADNLTQIKNWIKEVGYNLEPYKLIQVNIFKTKYVGEGTQQAPDWDNAILRSYYVYQLENGSLASALINDSVSVVDKWVKFGNPGTAYSTDYLDKKLVKVFDLDKPEEEELDTPSIEDFDNFTCFVKINNHILPYIGKDEENIYKFKGLESNESQRYLVAEFNGSEGEWVQLFEEQPSVSFKYDWETEEGSLIHIPSAPGIDEMEYLTLYEEVLTKPSLQKAVKICKLEDLWEEGKEVASINSLTFTYYSEEAWQHENNIEAYLYIVDYDTSTETPIQNSIFYEGKFNGKEISLSFDNKDKEEQAIKKGYVYLNFQRMAKTNYASPDNLLPDNKINSVKIDFAFTLTYSIKSVGKLYKYEYSNVYPVSFDNEDFKNTVDFLNVNKKVTIGYDEKNDCNRYYQFDNNTFLNLELNQINGSNNYNIVISQKNLNNLNQPPLSFQVPQLRQETINLISTSFTLKEVPLYSPIITLDKNNISDVENSSYQQWIQVQSIEQINENGKEFRINFKNNNNPLNINIPLIVEYYG